MRASNTCGHILQPSTAKSDCLSSRYSWGACLAAHAAAQLKEVTAFVGVSPVTGKQFCPSTVPTCDLHLSISGYSLLFSCIQRTFGKKPVRQSNRLLCTGSVASFCLRSKRHLAELRIRPDLPKFLILGDHDQFSSLSGLQKVFQLHKQKAGLHTPDSTLAFTRMETMADCDHFFANHRSELAQKIMSFCASANEVANQRGTSHSGYSDRMN